MDLKKPSQPEGHFDPTDSLTEEERIQCYAKVEEELKATNDKELNLEKSSEKVAGQEWVLVSFVGSTCGQKTDQLGMKIWGCFDCIKDANSHAKKLSKMCENKIFDIFILEMYTWAKIPPDTECINDQQYHEEQLHEIITDHKRQIMRSKEVFDTRKGKLTSNEDVNQFNKNKQELASLLEEDENTIQNKDAHKEVFGEPEQLPKLELTPANEQSGVVSDEVQYNEKFYDNPKED